MTLAPYLTIKMLGGIAITAFWLVPLHISRAEFSLWQLADWQPTDTTAVSLTVMHETESYTSTSIVNGRDRNPPHPSLPKYLASPYVAAISAQEHPSSILGN